MTIDYAAFRSEVEKVAIQACPDDIREAVATGKKISKPELKRWQEILNARGWGAPSWSTENGGTGWDIWQRLIFEEVMADHDCPPLFHHGLGQIGPVIIQFGTPDQKARLLPRILDGSDWWCQGYSEPGSGSDLASLGTTARKEGHEWVINGQKIWTSHAHEANMIYMLVRTSKEERKQEGISLILVPMNTAGIEVRPIRTIDGWHHLNEVFFSEVRVREDNLLGGVGQGWQCAKYLLERERLPASNVARIRLLHRQIKRMLDAPKDPTAPLRDLSSLHYKLLTCEADIKAATVLMAGAIDGMLRKQPLGVQPSVIKMICADVAQRLTTIAMDVQGPLVVSEFCNEQCMVAPGGQWIQNYFLTRARTIAGGTTEVQRNLVAKQLFKV